MGPNITCRALILKTADLAQSMCIGNLNTQIWALNTYIGPGPKVLSSDRPTIYNHASRGPVTGPRTSNVLTNLKNWKLNREKLESHLEHLEHRLEPLEHGNEKFAPQSAFYVFFILFSIHKLMNRG